MQASLADWLAAGARAAGAAMSVYRSTEASAWAWLACWNSDAAAAALL